MKFSCNSKISHNLSPSSVLLLCWTLNLWIIIRFFQGGFYALVLDFEILWEDAVLFPWLMVSWTSLRPPQTHTTCFDTGERETGRNTSSGYLAQTWLEDGITSLTNIIQFQSIITALSEVCWIQDKALFCGRNEKAIKSVYSQLWMHGHWDLGKDLQQTWDSKKLSSVGYK